MLVRVTYQDTHVGNSLLKVAEVIHADNCNRGQSPAERKQQVAECSYYSMTDKSDLSVTYSDCCVTALLTG